MSTSIEVLMVGNAGRDCETPGGNGPAAKVSIAHTPRKRDDATGEWSDAGDTIWVTLLVWSSESSVYRSLKSVRKGDRVLVKGALSQNRWADAEGRDRFELQISHPRVVEIVDKGASSNGGAPAGVPSFNTSAHVEEVFAS